MSSQDVASELDIDLAHPTILGFGVTGQEMAKALKQRGHRPTVLEDRPTDSSREVAERLDITLVESPKAEDLEAILLDCSVLLPSPGVPDHHPVFAASSKLDLPIRSEFDLAAVWDERPLVAITGTNGKTTVTLLVVDALERSGLKAVGAGNTETPLVRAIEDSAIEVFVVEASSFRLGHSKFFSPDVAAWLNLTPDHLDSHSSLETYTEAKASIWANLVEGQVAIANFDDPVVMAHAPAGVTTFSTRAQELPALKTTGAKVDWRLENSSLIGPEGPIAAVSELNRSQPHDLANGLAVASIAHAAGASYEAIASTLVEFSGLPHRVQFVVEVDGVSWFNDSKATSPHATIAAACGFDSVVLIAGGRNKGFPLEDLLATVPPVRHVVAVGDASEEITEVFSSVVPVEKASSMDDAVELASLEANSGDTVLLSPACTSFDWYKSYGERGDDFIRAVNEVVGP